MSVIPGLDGNWALNPTVHTLGGWINDRPDATLTRDTTNPISGPGSAMVTKTGQFGEVAAVRLTGGYLDPADPDDWTDPAFQAVPVTVGNKVTWTLDVRCDVACEVDVGLFPFDASGEQVPWDVPGQGLTWGVQEVHVVAANTVARVGCTILIPEGCVGATMSVNVTPQAATVVGTRTWLDNLLIEPDSSRAWVPPDQFGYHPADTYDPLYYCDGDTEGYAWAGTAGESITILAPVAALMTLAAPAPPPVLGQVTLGCGEPTVYLYDRGGQQRLYRFEAGAVITLDWERVLSATGTATLVVDAALCDCGWLGRMRAVRMELVIYRDSDRVWEGPITRIAYAPNQVTFIAKDVSWWFGKRILPSYFRTGNAVDLAYDLATMAFAYDDPHARGWLTRNNNKAPTYTAAYNKADGYIIDALDDLVEAGIDWSVLGRRIFFWASINPVAQTNMIRGGRDLSAEITVIEDGESLATRTYATGGETWGGAMLTGSDLLPAVVGYEPVVTNWATNPSLRIDATGFEPFTTRFFTVARLTSGWSSAAGGTYGKLGVILPAADSDAESDYRGFEMVLSMKAQFITVAKGQQISAILTVRPTGTLGTSTDPEKQNTLSLCWRGKMADGTIEDRPFIEGPPVALKSNTDIMLFVTGVVPEDITTAWVEVARDVSVDWKNSADGFWFDRFAIWNGRVETWFDGDTTDTADLSYEWLSSPGQSRSSRYFDNTTPRAPQTWPTETQYQRRISDYYGIVDHLADSNATTRPDLEEAAKSALMHAFPAPLGIDIPQDAPLHPNAPVTINELMAGTIVPIQAEATCRQVGAMPVLDTVKASYSADGEAITVTLLTAQAWEVEPPPDPEISDSDEGDQPDNPPDTP